MRRIEKARRIGRQLDALYPDPPIPLRHRDPWTFLVSVVLSAQCTDRRVNEVAPRLWALAPTPHAMLDLDVARIADVIRPVGLAPTKARHLHAAAAKIVADHRGEVPRTLAELEALPGVGHKTARVVVSQAFGVPAFPVDTHVARLAWRWGLSTRRDPVQTERDLTALYPEQEWTRRHLQFIFFGREHCPARGHDPAQCPICSWAGNRTRLARETRKGAGQRRRSRTGARRRTRTTQ